MGGSSRAVPRAWSKGRVRVTLRLDLPKGTYLPRRQEPRADADPPTASVPTDPARAAQDGEEG